MLVEGFALGNSLFGTVMLTKNSDFESILDITFVADMSSLVHIDNKKKDTLILSKGPPDGLHDTTYCRIRIFCKFY